MAVRCAFPPSVAIEVKAIACALPAILGLPLARLHVPDTRAEVLRRGLVAQISDATIWRWLSDDAIAPWRHRSWIFPRDPDFEAKADRVLDLYAGRFEGRRLRRGEYVVSADEKTSIQARIRCHPTLPPAPGRTMRVEHEYERGGALQYLAAWDVHRARLFGRCERSAASLHAHTVSELEGRQCHLGDGSRASHLMERGPSGDDCSRSRYFDCRQLALSTALVLVPAVGDSSRPPGCIDWRPRRYSPLPAIPFRYA